MRGSGKGELRSRFKSIAREAVQQRQARRLAVLLALLTLELRLRIDNGPLNDLAAHRFRPVVRLQALLGDDAFGLPHTVLDVGRDLEILPTSRDLRQGDLERFAVGEVDAITRPVELHHRARAALHEVFLSGVARGKEIRQR